MPATVKISVEDYQRMRASIEYDPNMVNCDTCGAWLHRDEAACATTDDYTGCWKMATGDSRDDNECKSRRAAIDEEIKLKGQWSAPE